MSLSQINSLSFWKKTCGAICARIHRNSPGLHAALQHLQAGLDQVQRLEQQSGAGPAERATHESFDGRVSLRWEGRKQKQIFFNFVSFSIL